MKNCAIVCEYNPFHTGHKYQLDFVRELVPNNIFCVMSGAFVQSATPAFCEKSLRAECALLGGANAVIELPTVYATASAQAFAEGALKIISGIKNISHMAMGAVADCSDILKLADIKIKHASQFSTELKKHLKSGKSYNAANAQAFAALCETIYGGQCNAAQILTDPNAILCIEYICAIDKYAANIEPLIIKRRGEQYNSDNRNGDYISATAIRNAEIDGKLNSVKKYIPYKFDEIAAWRNYHAPDINCYKNMAVYALKTSSPNQIRNLRNCSEGMEFLLKDMSNLYDFDEYIDKAIGKRYSKKRLYRLFFDLLLNIDKSTTEKKFCTRLLACKNDFDFTLLPSCVKTNNADIKFSAEHDSDVRAVLDIDLKATALFNTLCRLNGDYFNYSLIKL